MDRNTNIKSKLLQAFNPSLPITPFRSKNKEEIHSSQHPVKSSTSITRQSYINLEEHLQDNLVSSFTASHATSQSLNKTKQKRKYIQVISNPNQIFNPSFMKGSCILDNNSTALMGASNTALSTKKHHSSCSNLPSFSSDPRIGNTPPPSQRRLNANQINRHIARQPVQQLRTSKIYQLTQLISGEQLPKKQQLANNCYLQVNPNPSAILNRRTQSPQRITRAYSLQIRNNSHAQQTRPLLHLNPSPNPIPNIRPSVIHTSRMPSPSPLRPSPPNNLVLTCIPLNNGQPAFRTIVKKDISYPQEGNKQALKLGQDIVQAKAQERYTKIIGKQNQFFAFDTANMRNQIAHQILK